MVRTIDISAEDPFAVASEELFRDPYPFYDRIRSKGNLVWSNAGEKRWIAVGYGAVVSILNDPRFSVDVPEEQIEVFRSARHNVPYTDLVTGFTKMMLSQDPPQHTRVRKLANKAFTRAEVTEMAGRIEQIIDSLLDRVGPSGKMDFVADFAFLLPITIICEVLGLPSSDHEQLRRWSGAIARVGEPVPGSATIDAGAQATTELFEYLRDLIAERRKKPGKDLLSAFIQAEEEGDKLSLDELLANMLLLVIAGHETTVNLLGNGMLALLEHPDAMDKLRKQRDLIPTAIEEFLRYQSPFQITERYVAVSLELEGQSLKKGESVSVILGAANRDPQHFERPHELNIERQPNKHLAFGQGIHFCLGAPLARFESKLAFEKLLARLENIELAVDEVEYKRTAAFRSLQSLPIKFDHH